MSCRATVVFAEPRRQRLWTVVLPAGATVAQALEAAAASAAAAGEDGGVPWRSASVGIFGEPCGRSTVLHDGDRIELYLPLPDDPRERRRRRAGRR